jgi:small-conductance mechanosensitive channel
VCGKDTVHPSLDLVTFHAARASNQVLVVEQRKDSIKNGGNMEGLVRFMNGTTGRALRVVLGLVLIYLGLAVIGGTTGLVVAVIGLLPIALGLWGKCILQLVSK